MNLNPFLRNSPAKEIWDIKPDKIAEDLSEDALIVWDSRFSPIEGGLPLEALQQTEEIQHIRTFTTPDSSFHIITFAKIKND